MIASALPPKAVRNTEVPIAYRGDAVGVPSLRELNALQALAETGRYEQAAATLGLNTQSVKNMLSRLRAKLGVDTNLQAYHLLASGVRFVSTSATTIELERHG